MKRPTCETCPYCELKPAECLPLDTGRCRRTAPSRVSNSRTAWVEYSYWCGEHPEWSSWYFEWKKEKEKEDEDE